MQFGSYASWYIFGRQTHPYMMWRRAKGPRLVLKEVVVLPKPLWRRLLGTPFDLRGVGCFTSAAGSVRAACERGQQNRMLARPGLTDSQLQRRSQIHGSFPSCWKKGCGGGGWGKTPTPKNHLYRPSWLAARTWRAEAFLVAARRSARCCLLATVVFPVRWTLSFGIGKGCTWSQSRDCGRTG